MIPRLLIEIPLEGIPTIRLDCSTAEEEQALRSWLDRSLEQLMVDVTDTIDTAVLGVR